MKIGPLESKPVHAQPIERKNPPAPTPVATPTSKPTPTPTPAAAAAAARAEPSTKVALSPAASSLRASGASEPAFESAKVDRIAHAILGGKFEINAEAIADKLIGNAKELLSRTPS